MRKVLTYWPSSILKSIVYRYDYVIANTQEEISLRSYPGFMSGFIFSFVEKKPIHIKSELYDLAPLPTDNLVPPLSLPAVNHFSGYIEFIRVLFYPGILYHLYKIPMNTCANAILELGYVFDKELGFLTEELTENDSVEKKIQLIESYLINKISSNLVGSERYFYLHLLLLRKGYKMKTGELADELGESARNLNRALNKEVGFSTKDFIKVHRLNRILKRLRYTDSYRSLAELAHNFDFYDQAHFNREFKMLTGQNPTEYINVILKKPFTLEISDKEMDHSRVVEETN